MNYDHYFILIGGPKDGHTGIMTTTDPYPPITICVPNITHTILSEITIQEVQPVTTNTLYYELLISTIDDYPSVDDMGRYRYGMHHVRSRTT